MIVPPEFTKWWDEHGRFVRAGGGQYEISFAFAAWNEARRSALREAATCAAIHSQYPVTTDFDRGYSKARQDAADSIRAILKSRA